RYLLMPVSPSSFTRFAYTTLFRSLGRLSNPCEGPAFEPLIIRRARGPLPSQRRIPFKVSPFPVPVSKREEGEEEKVMNLNGVARSEERRVGKECRLRCGTEEWKGK